jgi:hypothetical protein
LFSFIFFLFPINLFDGEIIFEIQGQEIKSKAKLSLSYFIGVGLKKEDLYDVKDFYLLPMGYAMAFLIFIGLPSILAFRMNLFWKNKS